jgi:hypothetical protein
VPRLTYANVVATLALFLALTTGGAYAAGQLITGKDVKNSSLTGADIKNSSLTGSDVKDGSLTAKDLKAGTLTSGPAGAAGPAGPAGPAGAKGAAGAKGDRGDSAFSPMPSGTTYTSSDQLNDWVNASGTVRHAVPFPFKLSTPLNEGGDADPRTIFFGGTGLPPASYAAGEYNAETCSGTPDAPTAPRGVLCVYPGFVSNLSAGTISVRLGLFGQGDTIGNTTNFYVYGTSAGAGDTYLRFTWAYTAP